MKCQFCNGAGGDMVGGQWLRCSQCEGRGTARIELRPRAFEAVNELELHPLLFETRLDALYADSPDIIGGAAESWYLPWRPPLSMARTGSHTNVAAWLWWWCLGLNLAVGACLACMHTDVDVRRLTLDLQADAAEEARHMERKLERQRLARPADD